MVARHWSFILFLTAAVVATVPQRTRAEQAALEEQFYPARTIPVPKDITLEVSDVKAMADGRVFVCTRHGDVYTITGAYENDPAKIKYTRFATGLHEPLGIVFRDGWFYLAQRGELTRMKDTNGDGTADVFQTVSAGWGVTGDYHEYAFGPRFDKNGDAWVVLCLTGSFTSNVPWRGWAVRITPDGKMIPSCSGIRSPGGLGVNSAGEIFYTDNQGPWVGTCRMTHLEPGDFVGNPEGFKWFDDAKTSELAASAGKKPEKPIDNDSGRMHVNAKTIPQLKLPVVWFPYGRMGQSASGIVFDNTGGKFGPFAGQCFVGDQTNSTVMRVFMEKVEGKYQGACFPFRENLQCGTLGMDFGIDGKSLFVGQSARGWGSRGNKPFGLQRLVWSGQVPFEIHEMRATSQGFDLTFTQPVNRASAENTASYKISNFIVIHRGQYGSPEVDKGTPKITAATVDEDGRRVRLVVQDRVEGHIHELHLDAVKSTDGKTLVHPVGYYTLNRIPAK